MATILITGATGFLGKYVVDEFLRHGYQVVAHGRNATRLVQLHDQGVQTLQGDLQELSHLTMRVDAVVHAAALSTIWGPWQRFYRNNVEGTRHVVQFCQANNIPRLVFISSPSIYTMPKDRLGIREDDVDERNMLTNYIRSKIMAEAVVREASESGISTVILRPRGIVGVGDTSIVPRLLEANRTMGIPLFRGGHNVVDLTCVENVALAIRLAVEADASAITTGVYNITNKTPRSLISILEQLFSGLSTTPHYRNRYFWIVYGVAAAVECLYKVLRIDKEPMITRYTVCTLGCSQTLDVSAATRDLGYEPIMSLDEGIARYVASLTN